MLDKLMALFAGQTLLKGGVIFAFFWAAWFDDKENQRERQAILLSGFLGATISLAVARAIAILAPYRERPIAALAQFQIPYSMSSEDIIHWSSFPSDHAALYVGVSVAILLAARRLGIIALVYTLVFICIPRMYVGLHYPSDILVGALIGTGAVLLTAKASLSIKAVQPVLRYQSQNPSLFYMVSFFMTAQLVDMFTAFRKLVIIVLHGMRGLG
jgi:undecaprenyl-diphosphatase